MNNKKKTRTFILDTSAFLSGKPIYLNNNTMVIPPTVSNELKPGGRDYRSFQFLMERGLSIRSPSKESIDIIKTISNKTGDKNILSKTDIEILALAIDINKDEKKEVIILTDDYSIQNVAHHLNIKFETIGQSGITKKFKWIYRCRGCGKRYKDNIRTCPICGAETKTVISSKKTIKK